MSKRNKKKSLNAMGGGGRRYDATQESINRNSLFWVQPAADAQKEYGRGDRRKLIKLSRYLRDNLGVCAGINAEISRYSVGSDTRPQAQSVSDQWNDRAERWWGDWTEIADVSRQHSFGAMLDIWCQSMFVDGEVFPVNTEADGLPAIQTIFSHAIDWEDDKNERIIDGIRYGRNMQPLAYYLQSGRRINANAVHHIREPQPNRLRGVPAVAVAANNLFDLRDILSFEKQGVKLNSSIALVLKQAAANATGNRFAGGGVQSVSNDSILTLESVIGGANIPRIGPADTLDIHRSDKTSPTFTGFLEWLIRDLATGYSMPYEFVWSAEKLGGTAQRFIMAKAQRRFSQIQHNFEVHLRNIWRYVIGYAIDIGQLPYVEGWDRVKWGWPQRATVDYGRDGALDLKLIEANMQTYEDYYAGTGRDWREALKQRAEERKLTKELGLDSVSE